MARDRLPPIEFEPADDGPSSSSSAPKPTAEQSRYRPRRSGRWVAGGAVVVLGLVAVAVLDQPSHDSSAKQSPTTTSAPVRFPPAPSTTTTLPVPTHWKASSYQLHDDDGTWERSPLSAGLVEGFRLSDANVTAYVPSPDGTRVLAFYGCSSALTPCAGDRRVAVGNINGTEVRMITPPDGRLAATPSWSPDSTKIVYAGLDDSIPDFAEIFIEDVTTGASNQITHLDHAPRGSALSPTFCPTAPSRMSAISGQACGSRAPTILGRRDP